MSIDLENRLRQYAPNLVADHLKAEYEYQINKWQIEIDHLIDARDAALQKMQVVLQTGANQTAAIKQQHQNAELAFGPLFFFGGPALSWLSGIVQYKVFPKFTAKARSRRAYVSAADTFESNGVLPSLDKAYITQKDHDKVWAKVFGDLTKGVAQFGVDRLIKPKVAEPTNQVSVIERVASSANSLNFKSDMHNALRVQAELTTKAIMSLAMTINEDSRWGADCLARLYKTSPRVQHLKPTEQETLGKALIVKDIDAQREKWADEWFYYGHTPYDTLSGRLLIEPIELELWAM